MLSIGLVLMTSRHLPAGDYPVKRVIGHVNLVVWSDESVSVSWSNFMQGEAFDGYRHGSQPTKDALSDTEKLVVEIVERVRRNDDDS